MLSAWSLCATLTVAQVNFAEPTAADGFRALSEWRIDEALPIATALYRRDPTDPGALSLVASVKYHMSDYAGAVTFYERASHAGAGNRFLSQAGLATAAQAATQGYSETVSEHFIIRHERGRDRVLVEDALATLEAAMARIGALLGWRPKSRVVVEFYPSAATLAAVSSLTEEDIENSGTIALCKWNRLMVTSPRAVVFGYAWRDTIAHELVHLLIGGASRNTVPIWLHEGIAKFAETAWRGEAGLALSVRQQEALNKAAKDGTLIPFEKMHPSMAKLKTQEEASLAFSEVFTFIEFLVDQKGWAGIRAVLKEMRQGASDAQAIETVFGASLDVLSKRWITGLPNRKIRRVGAQLEDHEVVIKERPDTPDDQLHGLDEGARKHARAADLLYARGRLKAAQRELERAYALSASPLVSAKLANISLMTGDIAAAEGATRAAIAGLPRLSGPRVTLAEILIGRDDFDGALASLDRAISINPFDPRIYMARLQIAEAKKDVEMARAAQTSIAALRGRLPRAPSLGTGALIELDGPLFSRVYIEIDGHTVPTAMTTPTAPFPVPAGEVTIRLVPPRGEATLRTIQAQPVGEDGRAQQIKLERGS